jgi:hypothetical protein
LTNSSLDLNGNEDEEVQSSSSSEFEEEEEEDEGDQYGTEGECSLSISPTKLTPINYHQQPL